MLIFIENTPRAYAWGSRDALPQLLGTAPNGEPQAELWLGAHPGAPASVAKASASHQTLIELIESDPEFYGVQGGQLPFLLKVLAIGAPLSLQVHPDLEQARAGFEREEAAGVPRGAKERNYGDPNHKPELLVAWSEVTALCGFRPLREARSDLAALAAAAGPGPGRDALDHALALCEGGSDAVALGEEGGARIARERLLEWALGGGELPSAAVRAIADALKRTASLELDPLRREALEGLVAAYPDDAGVLVSLLLHLVHLAPGEAIYLGAGQLHAYLGGVAVEVMAASDNVLRAGLTEKHMDVRELLSIVRYDTLDSPRLAPEALAPGLRIWQPDVPDFSLMQVSLWDPDEIPHEAGASATARAGGVPSRTVLVEAEHPLVLVVTEGHLRVDRVGSDLMECANVARGQSLYVSVGEPIELSGDCTAFIATVGKGWSRVSQLSTGG